MLDADLHRFESEGLNQTKAGLALRMAVHEGRIACSQIKRLTAVNDPRPAAVRALDSWRRSYVHASDRAAQAIDQLWDAYQWPPDAGRERRYAWRPPEVKR